MCLSASFYDKTLYDMTSLSKGTASACSLRLVLVPQESRVINTSFMRVLFTIILKKTLSYYGYQSNWTGRIKLRRYAMMDCLTPFSLVIIKS